MISYNYAEEEVYRFIKSQCSKDEEVEFMPYHLLENKTGHMVIPDMYLPKGCAILQIKPKTCIEVKANLLYDTLDRMRSMSDSINASHSGEGFHLMLVTMEPIRYLDAAYNALLGRGIEVKYFYNWFNSKKYKNESSSYVSDSLLSARKAFLSGPNTLFLGSGVGKSEGLPNWSELLLKILSEVTGREIRKEDYMTLLEANGDSSIIMGRYIRNLYVNRDNTIEQDIRSILYKNRTLGEINSKTIHEIGYLIKNNRDKVDSVITYNYDDLIEQQLSNMGIDACSIFDTHEPDNRFPVYHVHGILDEAGVKSSKIVLSEDDYHEQYRRSFLWSNVEQLHALQNNNCFFIGLSMTDPNLRRLLDFTKSEANSKNQRDYRCFAFMRRADVLKDIKQNKENFLEEQRYILESMGVRVIWYNDHNELPALIGQLYKE